MSLTKMKNSMVNINKAVDDEHLNTSRGHIMPLKRNNLSSPEGHLVETKYSKVVYNKRSQGPTALGTIGNTVISVQKQHQQTQQQHMQLQEQRAQTILYDSTGVQLKAGTPIKLPSNKQFGIPVLTTNGTLTPNTMRRPTIFIKGPVKKTIRNVTMELIEKSPQLHVGVTSDRLQILKTVVCQTAKVSLVDLYITLKKLRLNEDFALLGEYFEYPELEIQKICARTIVKLAKYLKFLIRWPEGKKYYDRHKNLPISFRSKLSYVQSLIECVETDVRRPDDPTIDMIELKNFKFILTITPCGVISYISEAYVGNIDDLTIFNACNFKNIIPKYLSLVADPGDGIYRNKSTYDTTGSTTDSAEEIEEINEYGEKNMRKLIKLNHKTMNIVNSHLTSLKVKDFSIPTLRVREPACRIQIRSLIYCLREFKILEPYSVLDPFLYQYINEILVIISALINLQR